MKIKKKTMTNLSDRAGVQLDRVGQIGQNGVEGFGVPVVEQDSNRASRPDSTSEHRYDLRLDLESGRGVLE